MRATLPLLLLVAATLTLHALYVPAFEGPDEPFHLARTADIWRGKTVSAAIAGSITQHPCAADLRHATGCAPFGQRDAEFNVLQSGNGAAAAKPILNYEAHQPPLYYLVGRGWLEVVSFRRDPVWQLLWMRLFSVALVLLGVGLLVKRAPAWASAFLLVMLVPGAAESLARCANDAGVFAWCAAMVWAIERKAPAWALALLALIGPLIKLTAIPIIAFAVANFIHPRPAKRGEGPRSGGEGLMIAAASLAFLPIQWLRGYAWGGTVEMNAARAAVHETLGHAIVGFVRSAYTFVKTTFWLGEWSFFKAPLWLLVIAALFVVAFIACLRLRPSRAWLPHAIALLVAVIATASFFISHRRYWGDWGGVGGWYAWGWFPWLAVAVDDVFEVRRGKALFAAGAVIVAIANVAWFAAAHAIYG